MVLVLPWTTFALDDNDISYVDHEIEPWEDGYIFLFQASQISDL